VGLSQPPTGGRAQAGEATQEELHVAPETHVSDAPSESQLTPPEDAEKSALPPGLTEIENPAFPRPAQPPKKPKARTLAEKDLAPYFANGPLSSAKAEFDRGHYAKAYALLQGAKLKAPGRYLRGVAALRSEKFDAAADELTELVNDYPAVSDRALVHAGMAREELGQNLEAALLFSQVPPDSKLYTDARLGMARTLRKWGDPASAAWSLEPLAQMGTPMWGRDVGAEALIAIADLAKSRKDVAAERAALWSLWSKHPLSSLAKQADKRLKGQKPDTATLVARAETLVDAHRNEAGLTVLVPLLPSLKLPDPLACRAHFVYGKALRKQREHTKAIAALAPVVNSCTVPELKARALYVLGSSRSIVDLPNGTKTYEQLANEFPDHPFADDALFFAADLYAKTQQPQLAQKFLSKVSEKYPKGDFAAEALFRTFWLHRQAGRTEEAFKTLDTIEKSYAQAEETYELERGRYWRARLLESLGKKSEALDALEQLATEHPATYYGLMARGRAAQLDPERSKKIAGALTFGNEQVALLPVTLRSFGEDRHFWTGLELFRMGFLDAAAGEFLAVGRAQAESEELLLLVDMMSRAGDDRSAHNVARSALRQSLSGRITPRTRRVWQLAYPNPFRDMIEKHCGAASVDPDLLQALMREESALDPKALSWAGAVGLTQLMPATAKAVAKGLKIRNVNVQMLLEPDLNIRLGSWYLGTLVKRWDGNLPYAIASYNAGPGMVARWRDANGKAELDEWVEDIPISETRGYVKRVLRSYNTYQLLYARKPPVLSVFPPES
jgi:soluble lytic murein transglycosylase